MLVLSPRNKSARARRHASRICRVINGMWQVSGSHGFKPHHYKAQKDMVALAQAGFSTFDLADHYGPAEDYACALRGAK